MNNDCKKQCYHCFICLATILSGCGSVIMFISGLYVMITNRLLCDIIKIYVIASFVYGLLLGWLDIKYILISVDKSYINGNLLFLLVNLGLFCWGLISLYFNKCSNYQYSPIWIYGIIVNIIEFIMLLSHGIMIRYLIKKDDVKELELTSI
jgi:hypothetical protein